MLGMGKLDLVDLAAELLDRPQRRLEHRAHAGLDPVVGESGRDPEAQARRGPRGCGSSTPASMPTEVESQGSRPCRAWISSAASVTSRVSGPHWSSEEAKAIIP